MEGMESISIRESMWPLRQAQGAALRPFDRLRAEQAQGTATSFLIPVARVREDALPEHINYEDTGCEVAPRCLECPLARCRYDEPGGLRGLLNRDRDRRIAELRRRQRLPVDELAGRFGLSRRTVFRILKRAAESRRGSAAAARLGSPQAGGASA